MRKCDENLIEQAKAYSVQACHDVGVTAISELAEMYENNLANGFGTVYKMGFIKGQRAAESKQRRAAK